MGKHLTKLQDTPCQESKKLVPIRKIDGILQFGVIQNQSGQCSFPEREMVKWLDITEQKPLSLETNDSALTSYSLLYCDDCETHLEFELCWITLNEASFMVCKEDVSVLPKLIQHLLKQKG